MKKSHFLTSALLAVAAMACASVAMVTNSVPVGMTAYQHGKQRAEHHAFLFREVTLRGLAEAVMSMTLAKPLYVFQSTLSLNQGFGVIGEIVFDGPTRAQPGVVKGTAANIAFGRAFTIDPADGQFSPGGTNSFGGIMVNPKAAVSLGTSAGGPFAATMLLPVGEVAEFLTMGEILVPLINAAAIGAAVYFVQADGTLGAGTAGAGQTQIAGAAVKRYANAAAGIAVVSFTGP